MPLRNDLVNLTKKRGIETVKFNKNEDKNEKSIAILLTIMYNDSETFSGGILLLK